MSNEKQRVTLDMLKASLTPPPAVAGIPPFLQLAAVKNQFDLPTFSKDLAQQFDGYTLKDHDTEMLRQRCDIMPPETEWMLRQSDRKRYLAEMDRMGQLTPLVEALPTKTTDRLEYLLHGYILKKAPTLEQQGLDELACTFKIREWLEGTSVEVPTQSEVQAQLKREELLYHLRILTSDFEGRREELAYLHRYVTSPGKRAPLLISGMGGIGKSTLIARYILEHYADGSTTRMPFAFIDFDRPGISLSEPLMVAVEALRQLEIQFPQYADTFKNIGQDLRLYLHRDNKSQSISKAGTRGIIYDSISRQYLSEFRQQLSKINTPILIVLDSFEEAQFRSTSTELANLFTFLNEIREFVPTIRYILAGRDELLDVDAALERYPLGEFDPEAAKGYLRKLEITDPAMQSAIVQYVGGKPLTLNLAARAALDYMQALHGQPVDLADMFKGIDKTRIQQELLRRNLAHIKGGEKVQAIGFPGMLVRRISPQIIQKVLAEPCGLGSIDEAQAELLFGQLKQAHFLLSKDQAGNLVFRKDLRVAMYDLILEAYGSKARLIHDSAAAFYAQSNEAPARAENLYHCLMRGDDTTVIEQRYQSDMRPYLETALTELPLDARVRLAAKMGISIGPDIINSAKIKDWEAYMRTHLQTELNSGERSGLRHKKAQLEARTDRRAGSDFYILETQLYIRLNEMDKASALLETNKKAQRNTVEYPMLLAQWQEYHLDFEDAYEILAQMKWLDLSTENTPPEVRLQYLLQLLRNARREGISSPTLLQMPIVAQQVAQINQWLQSAYPSAPDKQQNWLFAALPRAYRPFANTVFAREENTKDVDTLMIFMENISRYCLSGKTYRQLYDLLLELENKGLEQKVFNKFHLSMTDIAAPAEFPICAMEVAWYLEQYYKGNLTEIRTDFLGLEDQKSSDNRPQEPLPPKAPQPISKHDTQRLDSSLLDDLRELIAEDQIDRALKVLLNAKIPDTMRTDLIMISSRYKNSEREYHNGVVSSQEHQVTLNKIRASILSVIGSNYP